MTLVPWPSVLKPNAENVRIDARTRSGGETINGREQVVSSGLGRWVMTLTVPLYSPETIRAWRSWLAMMDGRANYTLVGPCDCANANQVVANIKGIPYSDKTKHTDGAGFQQGGAAPAIAEAAAVGATQVTIFNGATKLPVLAGTFIGINDFLYVVVGVTPLPGEETRLDIRPKLRAAVAPDDPVEWCHARGPFRLLADDSGATEIQLARTGTATIDLVEVW